MHRIAVIGAGPAGLDFALRCVQSGFDVTLEDVMPSRLRHAEQAYAQRTTSSSLHLVTTVEDAVRDADLAIDFVPDELESKLEIFSLLDRMAPPRTLFCTPTARLSIADLASCTYRPRQCFALQFADPAARLIHPPSTPPETTASVERWLGHLGFTVTTAEDRTN